MQNTSSCMDGIVCGIYLENVKKRLLGEDKLTLDKAISICRAEEESVKKIQKMNEEQGNTLHFVKNKGKSRGATGGARPKEYSDKKFQCGKCWLMHEGRKCPAYGKLCHKCSKPHHFAEFCKPKFKKNLHNLHEGSSESDSDDIFVRSINEKCQKKTEISNNECITMDVNRIPVKFKIDTGSQCNIITDIVFKKVKTSLTFKCLIEHLLADFSYSRPLDTYLWKQMMKMNRNITYKWCIFAKKHLLFTKRKCHKFSWLFTASRNSPRRRSICACRIACKVLVSIGL